MRTILVIVLSLSSVPSAMAQDVAVAEVESTHPLAELRTLDSYFPFNPPPSLEQWQQRRETLRRHVQISLGLWPLPQRSFSPPAIEPRSKSRRSHHPPAIQSFATALKMDKPKRISVSHDCRR